MGASPHALAFIMHDGVHEATHPAFCFKAVEPDATAGLDQPDAALSSWSGMWLETRRLGDDHAALFKVPLHVLPCHLAGCPVICAEAALAVLDASSVGTLLALALLIAAVSVAAFLAGLACGLRACWLIAWSGTPPSGAADASLRRITPYLRASREAR